MQAYGRPTYGTPATRLVNMFVEATPGGPGKTARFPRPPIVQQFSIGANTIWKMFKRDGVFGGDLFTVSDTGVYREGQILGTVAAGKIRIDASSEQLVIIDSTGKAYCYNGGTFTQITDPDLPLVSDVAYIAGRFYYLQADSDIWWFSDIDDATSIDGLAFATAESAPDANVGVAILTDEVWFFGQETIEPWYQTGDPDAPLQRGQGRKFEKGCPAQESIVKLDNTLFFVGVSEDGLVVYRAAGVPKRISTHGIEEALSQATTPSEIFAYAAGWDAHPQYVLTIPGVATFAYDVSTSEWAEWQSYGRATFRGRCGIVSYGVSLIGDAYSGTVFRLDKRFFLDANGAGTDPVTRLCSAYLPARAGSVALNSVALTCVTGVGTATGQGSDPMVEMRYWDNTDEGWSEWEPESLGILGNYSARPRWQRLGRVENPGRLFEFRVTDPVNVVFEQLVINEPR